MFPDLRTNEELYFQIYGFLEALHLTHRPSAQRSLTIQASYSIGKEWGHRERKSRRRRGGGEGRERERFRGSMDIRGTRTVKMTNYPFTAERGEGSEDETNW